MATLAKRPEAARIDRAPSLVDELLARFGRVLLIGVPLAFLVIWTMVPIVWALLASLKDPLEIYESTSFLPRDPSLRAYWTVLGMDGFGRWMFNSILVTVVATIVPLA